MNARNARFQQALSGRRSAVAAGALQAVGICWLLLALGGCASQGGGTADGAPDDRNARLGDTPDAVPRVEPRSRYGNMATYVVRGKRYYTKQDSQGHVERGMASWYGKKFHGQKTSSGERYDMYSMTAAHKTLPLPTYARVTNVENGRSAVVRINDRGPFHGPRVIDLSYAAATKIGVVSNGTALVEVRAIDPARPDTDTRPSSGPFLAAKQPPVRSPTVAASAAPRRTSAPAKASASRERAVAAALAAIAPKPPTPPATDTKAPSRPQLADGGEEVVASKRASASDTRTAAAAPSAPAVAAEVGGAGKEGLYLQVGAFGDPRNAERLRERLTAQLAEQVRVQRPAEGSASLYKVRVGPFGSEGEARRVSAKLSTLGVTEPRRVWN
ncbi:septal ring lytic transglycosylase RlpA family protein [uncultured Lamprocystis sp.]|jgi:rare lipoprotein A|uniref:septal ring lytic transglycosylase RlpA family protein n=1 Tax=uncultured Lamprocystis sp. TaxID=543132 RepID=UPI0025F7A5B7|nr:septal ring lytic transglycosylase RlpA family protein [uncultured Lamprocystis sp.]